MTDAQAYGVQDDRTPGLGYPKPNPANRMRDDALRIAGALDAIDSDVIGLLEVSSDLYLSVSDLQSRLTQVEVLRRKERLRAVLGLSPLA